MKRIWIPILVVLPTLLSLAVVYAVSTTFQITRFVYDGQTPTDEGDEYVKTCNVSGGSLSLTGYKIGDEETKSGPESMYNLPSVSLGAGACIFIAKNANQFNTRWGNSTDTDATTDFSVTLPNAVTLRALAARAPVRPWAAALSLLALIAAGGLAVGRRRA